MGPLYVAVDHAVQKRSLSQLHFYMTNQLNEMFKALRNRNRCQSHRVDEGLLRSAGLPVRMVNRRRGLGFNLIELMVTVSIISIIVSIALPSFGDFQKNNRVKSVAQTLNSSIRLARSEAIAKNAFVRVEVSNDLTVTLCRIVASADACSEVDAENRFRVLNIEHNGVDVESGDVALATGFVFNSRGRLVDGALAIGVCDDRGADSGRVIQVNAVGRSNLREISDTAGATCS